MVMPNIDNPIEARVLGFIKHAENHSKYTNQRERAETCRDFEAGQQWTEEQYNRYKEVGVEPVVINRCLATIKALDGLFVENKQDITCIPRKGSTETSARVLSEIIKHALDTGGFDNVSAAAWRKGNIQTAGYMEVQIDKTKSANGQIVLQEYGFFDVLVDPDCTSYDMDKPELGAKYIIVRKWIDKDELQIIYDGLEQYDPKTQSGMDSYIAAVEERSQFYTEEEKQYRLPVYTIWWKEPTEALLVGDKQTGMTKIVRKDIEKFRRFAKKSNRFTAEKCVVSVLHKSVVINSKLMKDEEMPLGDMVDFFPIVRYVPIFREDYERGTLDDIVPINQEENLRRTQVNRLLIITANAGWKAGNTNNQAALEELKRDGSTPGFVADESKFGGKLEKITPNPIPSDFIIAKQSSQDLNEITGLNAVNRAYDEGTKNEPGVVLNMRRQQGITANSGLFDNFKTTLELLGNKLLTIIDAMDIYNEQEIRAIVEESHMIDATLMEQAEEIISSKVARLQPPQRLPEIPPQVLQSLPPEQMSAAFEQMATGIKGAQIYAEKYPMLRNQLQKAARELAIQMLLADLFNTDVTQYGIKVTTSQNTPTARLALSQQLMAIQDKYGAIPMEVQLEYMNIPESVRMKIKQQQRMMAAMSQQVQQPRQLTAGAA